MSNPISRVSIETLRARYRNRWDAYQILAYKNAVLLMRGQKPSEAQIAAEEGASAAASQARDELLAAISTIGK